ncbi:ATP-binding protein [Streptomyces ipomoeae]|nr:ATP-binding protein [Streptomyces ipomoeae]MDX2699771.1 ATP-binding protein [Streptomyces ipomoeae]MDX2825011.1 ATP-binding protein [Streptomyces ipomoeae]MDX2843322.1 ATP-binding protein [Streptomyces ipomoeae]MDX2879935.1 ATP-binding protein [Streptomyces ipomoeae]MDX2936660.1 ATP-binding protein [Streptomyces ipomoeae]
MAPPTLPQSPDRATPAMCPPFASAAYEPHRAGVFGLPATPTSAGEARRTVRELLDEWGVVPETREDMLLITSELVTNALTHTASEWIVCRLHMTGQRLRIEVEDQNSGHALPARRRPGPDDQNGRGLMLVGMLSSDWGVRETPQRSGRVVWAELPSEGRNTAEPVPPTARTENDVALADPSWT